MKKLFIIFMFFAINAQSQDFDYSYLKVTIITGEEKKEHNQPVRVLVWKDIKRAMIVVGDINDPVSFIESEVVFKTIGTTMVSFTLLSPNGLPRNVIVSPNQLFQFDDEKKNAIIASL